MEQVEGRGKAVVQRTVVQVHGFEFRTALEANNSLAKALKSGVHRCMEKELKAERNKTTMANHSQPVFATKDRQGGRYCCLAYTRVRYRRGIDAVCGIYVSSRQKGRRFHFIVHTSQGEWMAWLTAKEDGGGITSVLLEAMVSYRILPSAWRLYVPARDARLPAGYKAARTDFARETELYRTLSGTMGADYERLLKDPLFWMLPEAGFNRFGRTFEEDELFERVKNG